MCTCCRACHKQPQAHSQRHMHCSFIDGARARHACVTWRPWAACLRSRACGPLAAPSCPATRRSAPPPCSHSMTHTCVRDGYVVIKGTRAGAGTGGSIGARCAACARVAKPQTAKPHRRGKVLARASSLRERSEGSGQQAMLCAALGSGEVHTAARTHLSAVISASLQSTCRSVAAWRRGWAWVSEDKLHPTIQTQPCVRRVGPWPCGHTDARHAVRALRLRPLAAWRVARCRTNARTHARTMALMIALATCWRTCGLCRHAFGIQATDTKGIVLRGEEGGAGRGVGGDKAAPAVWVHAARTYAQVFGRIPYLCEYRQTGLQ